MNKQPQTNDLWVILSNSCHRDQLVFLPNAFDPPLKTNVDPKETGDTCQHEYLTFNIHYNGKPGEKVGGLFAHQITSYQFKTRSRIRDVTQ